LAPQPRLLWAVAIGATLIALSIVSPVLVLLAVLYHTGLVLILARDLALLPGRKGYRIRRLMPEPFSLGELRYRYPSERLPDGTTSAQYLRKLRLTNRSHNEATGHFVSSYTCRVACRYL